MALHLILVALLLLAMTGCTIGPTIETRYVIVHPGLPIHILEGATVSGERLDGAGVASFDIGGWIAMPPDHWAVIKGILDQKNMAVVDKASKP